jgi:hypothetical protein
LLPFDVGIAWLSNVDAAIDANGAKPTAAGENLYALYRLKRSGVPTMRSAEDDWEVTPSDEMAPMHIDDDARP